MKKKMYGSLLVLCLALGTALVAGAQEKAAGLMGPPKVLTVIREVLKPGKGGAAHEKTERAFIQAMTVANSPEHYIALDSLTGVSRSLFFTGYDSFAQWEERQMADQKNATLSAALDRAAEADGELLQSYESGVYVLREDQSYNPGDLAHVRYFEISIYKIKPGHDADWEAIVKMVKPALNQANPEDHWAMYEHIYGAGGPWFAVMRTLKSAAEIDHSFASDPKFAAAMGQDGMKKLSELSAAAIESSESNLFMINPRMSYVGPEMIKADPDFWKTASAVEVPAGRGNATEKPAQ
jgi:hypothetical protein